VAIVFNRDGWTLAVEGVRQGACMPKTVAPDSMAACSVMRGCWRLLGYHSTLGVPHCRNGIRILERED